MVVLSNDVFVYLENLVHTLIEKDYFSFQSHAEKYTLDLKNFIINKINTTQKRPAPNHLSFYKKGLQYIYYKRNKRTTWYIFFLQKGNNFLITHITNNHDVNFTAF